MLAGDPAVGEVLVSGPEIAERVVEMGAQITADYAGREPLLVAVLKGAVMFASDLSRAIDLPVEMDFMAVSSYGSSTRSSGVVRILKDLDIDIAGRDVILVEDIVESGLTLSYLRRQPARPQPRQPGGVLAADPRAQRQPERPRRLHRISPAARVGHRLRAGSGPEVP